MRKEELENLRRENDMLVSKIQQQLKDISNLQLELLNTMKGQYEQN